MTANAKQQGSLGKIAGFLLTGVSNWTGAPAIAGSSLLALGHTGRPLIAAKPTIAAFVLICAAAVLRVIAASVAPTLVGSAAAWVAALVLWVWAYAPILWQPRIDDQPGSSARQSGLIENDAADLTAPSTSLLTDLAFVRQNSLPAGRARHLHQSSRPVFSYHRFHNAVTGGFLPCAGAGRYREIQQKNEQNSLH